MTQQVCPKCGKVHAPGTVGAAAKPGMRAPGGNTMTVQPFQTPIQWNDACPYAFESSPGGVSTWRAYAMFMMKKHLDWRTLWLTLEGTSGTAQERQDYVDVNIPGWLQQRWPTVNAWMNEITSWTDENGTSTLMWLTFQLWWYGFGSASRGQHQKCAHGTIWDPMNLRCITP